MKSEKIKEREIDFHDKVVDNHGEYTYHYGLLPIPDEKLYRMQLAAFELLGDINGKDVLDLGCGAGGTTAYLAKLGGTISAIDISPKNVEQAQKWCKEAGVEAKLQVMDCERLEYSDDSFDCISGSFLLHHVDTEEIAREVKRVCRKGGRAVFIETFASHPILMMFRDKVLPIFGLSKSSDDEYPLSAEKIKELEAVLGPCRLHDPELILFRLIASYGFKDMHLPRKFFSAVDDVVYRLFPFMRKYSYYRIIEFPNL